MHGYLWRIGRQACGCGLILVNPTIEDYGTGQTIFYLRANTFARPHTLRGCARSSPGPPAIMGPRWYFEFDAGSVAKGARRVHYFEPCIVFMTNFPSGLRSGAALHVNCKYCTVDPILLDRALQYLFLAPGAAPCQLFFQ
jgi:hypothetical protein